ncbi:MAG: hypothetical protein MUC97_16415 [Bernardetiaceae bacterium]|jgi:hypothetical protein|nr:hypothetical protein [Bernardetiaceae bacterium]
MKKSLLLVGLVLALATRSVAQTQVALFKNGTSFYSKNLTLEAKQGFAQLPQVPRATFGTFWVGAEGNAVRRLATEKVARVQKRAATGLADLLPNLLGQKVSLVVALGEDTQTLEGTLLAGNAALLSLRTAQGVVSLPLGQVLMCTSAEAPNYQHTTTDSAHVLRIDFANPAASQPVSLAYLQNGLSWVPTYRLDLTDPQTASVALFAEVLNDAEGLENAQLNFVVGVPNFAYSYLASPLAQGNTVEMFINQLNRNSNNYYSGRMGRADITRQSMANLAADLDDGDATTTVAGETEDLYFYPAQKASLPKGGRAFFPILTAKSPYEHVYEVSLPAANESSPRADQAEPLPVWHSISLQNTSSQPWTTGAAFLSRQQNGHSLPLGQDKLTYTPPGAKVKVRLTTSPNVVVKTEETETTRKEAGKLRDGYFYDLVTVEAKIQLRSYKSEPIKLVMDRYVEGEPLRSDLAWKTDKLVSRQTGYSLPHRLGWETELKPGEARTVTYSYQMYVRR